MSKVLHMINSLKHGGAENVALNYALVQQKIGIEPIILSKESSDEYRLLVDAMNIEVTEVLTRGLIMQLDYIFVHSNQNLLKLLPFYPIIRKRGIKVFYVQHLNYSPRKFSLLSCLINTICTDFIQITPITTHLVEKYIKIPVHFIVNFYNNKYPKQDYPKIRQQVREQYKIETDQTLLMFSAVFKPGKGLSEFLELAVLFSGNRDYRFIIVGDGPERSLVENYKFDNIIWTGFVNDVEKYHIASDIYVFTSLFKQEMMPMALIEAINCDKKILAFNSGINDFCLNKQTYATVSQMRDAVDSGTIPSNFTHYDADYAVKTFKNILA